MTAAKPGDRVRVTYEGTVEGVTVSDARLKVRALRGSGGSFGFIEPEHVEILAPKIKVGDTVEGHAEYDALPVGALAAIVTSSGDTDRVLRTRIGFVDEDGEAFMPCSRRTIRYLPGGDQ